MHPAWQAQSGSSFTWATLEWDDGDPSLGVREHRKPKPPTRSGGAAAELYFEPEPEAEGIAQGASVNVSAA